MTSRGRQWLMGGLVMVVVAMGAWVLRPPTSASVSWDSAADRSSLLPAGSAAPAFALPTAEGDTVRSEALAGDRLALVFVRPGCPHCDRLLTGLSGVTTGPGRYLLVISTAGREAVRQLQREHRLSVPLLADSTGQTAQAYGVTAVPCGYLIDERGRIETSAQGMPAARELVEQL